MGWDDVKRNSDDVLLPLDLAELLRKRPADSAGPAERASWLLWKASLFDRLVKSEPSLFESAEAAANEARKAGLRLLRDVAAELVACPLSDEGQPEQTWADALDGDGGEESSAQVYRLARVPVGFATEGSGRVGQSDVATGTTCGRPSEPAAARAGWRLS